MLSQPCQATPRRPPPFQLILGSAHHDVRVGMGSALILSERSNSELLLDYTKTVVGLCAAIKEYGDANVSFCFAVKEQGGISKAMGTDLARKTTDCAWKGKNAKRMPLTILTPFLLESVVCRTRRKSIAERWRPCCLPNHPWPPWQAVGAGSVGGTATGSNPDADDRTNLAQSVMVSTGTRATQPCLRRGRRPMTKIPAAPCCSISFCAQNFAGVNAWFTQVTDVPEDSYEIKCKRWKLFRSYYFQPIKTPGSSTLTTAFSARRLMPLVSSPQGQMMLAEWCVCSLPCGELSTISCE